MNVNVFYNKIFFKLDNFLWEGAKKSFSTSGPTTIGGRGEKRQDNKGKKNLKQKKQKKIFYNYEAGGGGGVRP